MWPKRLQRVRGRRLLTVPHSAVSAVATANTVDGHSGHKKRVNRRPGKSQHDLRRPRLSGSRRRRWKPSTTSRATTGRSLRAGSSSCCSLAFSNGLGGCSLSVRRHRPSHFGPEGEVYALCDHVSCGRLSFGGTLGERERTRTSPESLLDTVWAKGSAEPHRARERERVRVRRRKRKAAHRQKVGTERL